MSHKLGSVLLLILCCFTSVEAAAPYAHLFFAERWLTARGVEEDMDRRQFISGTLFPDIRYSGTIKRSATHVKGVKKEDILLAASCFSSGLLLHSFVDEKREKFVRKSGVLNRLYYIPRKLRVLFLKLLEDEILWSRERSTYAVKICNHIYAEELEMGVSYSVVEMWHNQMQEYFLQQPSLFLAALKERNAGFLKADKKQVAIWADLLPLLARDPYFVAYLNELVLYLDHQLAISSY